MTTTQALLKNFQEFPSTWFKKCQLITSEVYGKQMNPIDADRRLREMVQNNLIDHRIVDGHTEYKLKTKCEQERLFEVSYEHQYTR